MTSQSKEFSRNLAKSHSHRKKLDTFDTEVINLKRNSQFRVKNKFISEFETNIDKENNKLHSRTSLPIEIRNDHISDKKSDKSNIFDDTIADKKSQHSQEKDKMSSMDRNKSFFDSFQGGIKDIKIIWKNKTQIKEEKDPLDLQYENIENFLNHVNNKCKANENIEANYSSSTMGFASSKKNITKQDDKNTKINLKNIIHDDKNNLRRSSLRVILSDILDVENKDNKLDVLIKTMDEYKEIVMEKMFCKNFQDRLILNIYICLSQLSFKLYNCIENKKKFENIRKYISFLTDDIKYNLINNPNFTISLINQKFIDIDNIDKNILINYGDEMKVNDNNPINVNINDSSLNFISKTNNKINESQDSWSNSNSNTESKKINNEKYNFFNYYEEEIIYENFEEFNNGNENDKDAYANLNLFYEIDNKNNNDENMGLNKVIIEENNGTFPKKSSIAKVRRNATHRIFLNKQNIKSANYNNTSHYFNQKNYDFQIIDINGKNDKVGGDSDDSIDSDEQCIEVTESYKFEKQKLIFYEDYVKDKDKRRITKVDSIELKPDSKFLKEKATLKELNTISYNNIINIINDDPYLLPNHQLNLDPIAIANFIKERERILVHENSDNNSIKEENDEIKSESDDNDSDNNNESDNENDNNKDELKLIKLKRFDDIKNINENGIEDNSEENKENYKKNEEDKNYNNNDNKSNSSKKSWLSRSNKFNDNSKIFLFNDD